MGFKEMVAAGLILLAVLTLREWLAAMFWERQADREEAFAIHMADTYGGLQPEPATPSEAVVKLVTSEPTGNGTPPPAESVSVSD